MTVVFMAKLIDEREFDGNFVREVEPVYRGNKKDRRVELVCFVCGKNFIATYANAKRTRQRACSNQCGGILTRRSELGNENSIHYPRWLSMRDRCNNPNNDRYNRYGARGITYAKEFNDFLEYENYITSLPDYDEKSNKSLDRIDNNLGYLKGNLRWASCSVQSANKTAKKTGASSKYIGVHFCNTHKSWIAKVQYKGKIVFCKYYSSERLALIGRNEFITDNNLPHAIQAII